MVPARDTAAGVAAGAGTSGETVFRRGAGAGGAARVDPLLRRISGLSKILCRGQHILAQQRAHQRIQTQSLHTLDFMQVRVRGLGSHTRRARNRPSKGHPAPNRRRW